MSFVPASITLAGSFHVEAPVEEAFPLFSPKGEEAWVAGWKAEILYPEGAEWECGLVFRTRKGESETIWFVTELDRQAHRVGYHRVEAGMTAVMLRVECEEAGASQTRVSVRYTFVGISEAGNEAVLHRSQREFDEWMQEWESSIAPLFAKQ